MDKYHNHEGIFIKLLDFGIDVLLIDLMQIVRDIRDKQYDDICMSRHKSCLLPFLQILVDSLDEWLYFRPRGGGFGASRLLDLANLFRLLAFRVRQR